MLLGAASPPVRKKGSGKVLRGQHRCYLSSARFSGCVQVEIPAGKEGPSLLSPASGSRRAAAGLSLLQASVPQGELQHCQLQRVSSSSVQGLLLGESRKF